MIQVSAFNQTEIRGEQAARQIEAILATTGAEKVNIIGHSHGGPLQDHGRARRALEAATTLAADARDDRTAAMAWSELVLTLVDARELATARTLLAPADAAIRRAGEPPIERHRLRQAEGMLTYLEGDPAAARPLLTEALAFTEAQLGADSNFATDANANLASVESQLDDHAAAIAHRRRVLAIEEARLGRASASYAAALGELGIALRQGGDPEALATLRDAVARSEAAGVTGPPLAILLQSLGNAESDAANHPAAVAAFDRAVAIYREARSPLLADALAGLGAIRYFAGDLPGAIAASEEALPLLEAQFGREHFQYAFAEGNLGALQPCDAVALARLDHATKVLSDQIGADHAATIGVRASLGACQLVLAPAAGVATLEAVLAACKRVECDPAAVTQARDELAKHRRR